MYMPRDDCPSFWRGPSLRLYSLLRRNVNTFRLPLLLEGPFIEARRSGCSRTTAARLPLLLEGPFIEAPPLHNRRHEPHRLPLLLEGPFIEAILNTFGLEDQRYCPSFWRGPSLRRWPFRLVSAVR